MLNTRIKLGNINYVALGKIFNYFAIPTITFVVANKQSGIKVELFAYMRGLLMQLALF